MKIDIEQPEKVIEEFLRRIHDGELVNVVRCKDCEWWTKQKDSAQGKCELLGTNPTGGWYCANGKRKELINE